MSGITLEQVIDFYGAPEKILAYSVPGDHQYQIVAIELFYASRGLVISASKKDEQRIDRLTPDFQVEQVAFWKARSLEAMATEFRETNSSVELSRLSNADDWPGYGEIVLKGFR